jgi:hypothetical protein
MCPSQKDPDKPSYYGWENKIAENDAEQTWNEG